MEKIVQAKRIDLWCETFGDPADPAVLLIMGNGTPGVAQDDDVMGGHDLEAPSAYRTTRPAEQPATEGGQRESRSRRPGPPPWPSPPPCLPAPGLAWAALAWMVGFGTLHGAWAIAGAVGAGWDAGPGFVGVNLIYTVVSFVGAAVVHAMIDPQRSVLPPWVVGLGARIGSVALAFVGTVAAVHQIQILAGALDQPARWTAFEAYGQLGALLLIPVAVRHLRRTRAHPAQSGD